MRFETLIEQHHDEIYGYLWRLTRNTADAQDLTQEVFLRAYQAFGRLRSEHNLRAWLYKIATNCAYTAFKRDKRQAQHTVALLDDAHGAPADAASPHQQTAVNESLAAVRQAMAGLPDKQRQALLLRHVQGLEYAEVAQALGCSQDSARANVYQAIRRLRRELGDREGS